MKSFWELDEKWVRVITLLEESEGELTDEINELLAINRTELNEVIEAQLMLIEQMKFDIDRHLEENKRIVAKIKSNQASIKTIKAGIAKAVKKYGELNKNNNPILKVAGKSLSIQKTTAIEVIDTSQIPTKYFTYTLKNKFDRKLKLELQRLMSRFGLEFTEAVKLDELKSDFEKGEVVDYGFRLHENESLVTR